LFSAGLAGGSCATHAKLKMNAAQNASASLFNMAINSLTSVSGGNGSGVRAARSVALSQKIR
jgi:hypothetical protein